MVHKARELHLRIQLAEQLRRQLQRLIAALGVDGLFIAGGGLGAVVVPQGRPADAGGVEVGHLQNDLVGGGQDGVLGTAHDARQRHNTGIVGNDQIVGGKGEILAVEQQQLFALLGPADDDMALNVIRVEGVGGLAGGQHHIVGDIHQRIDGPHPRTPQAALHPEGGGLDAHAGQLSPDVPGAALRVLHRHRQSAGGQITGEGAEPGQGQPVQGGDLTGQTVVAPQVGAVGHGLVVDLQNDVVKVQRIGNGGAGGYVKGTEIQNVGLLVGGEQIPQPDLGGGADHTVALDAPQLGFLNFHRLTLAVPAAQGAGAGHGHPHPGGEIGAAADDLPDVAATDIRPADPQLVGVGMGADLRHYAHQHMLEALGQVLGPLHLHGGHGQVIGQTGQVHILRELYIILDPIQ